MGFRTKIVLSITITFLLFFLLANHVTSKLIFDRFGQLERDYAYSDLGRIIFYIEDSFRSFDEVVKDWAAWDGTYAFIKDGNRLYRQSNLQASTFDTLRLDLMMLCNSEGKALFSSGYDHQNGRMLPLAAEQVSQVIAGFTGPEAGKAKHGLILTSAGAVMVSAHPILRSDGTGPSQGTLIMGRHVNNNRVSRLISVTHLFVKAYPLNRPDLPATVRSHLAELQQAPLLLQEESRSQLNGFVLLYDVFRRPAIVFVASLPRDLYFQSRFFSTTLSLVLLGSLLLACLVSLVTVQGIIVRPITKANMELSQVIAYCDLVAGAKLKSPKGKDELATLQSSVDNMLTELENRHKQTPPNHP